MDKKSPATKYTHLAPSFSERSYVDPMEFMGHRLRLTLGWGSTLAPGDSVLELGCGDGYLGCLLAGSGLGYTGVDIAPGMIDAARGRALAAGAAANFLVSDFNALQSAEGFDAVVAYCRTFFAYADSPIATLRQLRPSVRKKIIVDWNRYSRIPLGTALRVVKQAGFSDVTCRPFLVPTERRIPRPFQTILYRLEDISLLGMLLTRSKFCVLIKGEVA